MNQHTTSHIRLLLCAVAGAFALAGCGGNSTPQNTGTVTPPTAMSESQRETNALPLTTMAKVPSSLHCSGAIVWANPARKNYHMSGDPYYGRTRHGQYMCEETAQAQGYHPAGTRRHHGARGSMMQATPQPEYT